MNEYVQNAKKSLGAVHCAWQISVPGK